MKFWALLALAASISAIPFEGGILHKRAGARIHIGYRIVSKEEADAINDNDGKAVQSRGTMGRQLGTGTYISPAFHDFPDYDPSKGLPWDCAVTIDADDWAGLKKAWIPKMFEFPEDKEKNPDKCKPLPLWTPRWVANRKRFLKHLDPTSTPENTVLFSVVLGHEEKQQALIPKDIIGSVDVYLAQCAERGTESNAQIGELGTVDWGLKDLNGWGLGVGA
ncbi:hypothetical protein QBC40DRAFT_308879 [Triangularia verruculosa]|uniref:Uncharacterized protein n=1 Tax=Triangularia verruculosa TaxID=2587418 RepID=A0AAN6XFG1_9PEZI|nr:hypothetical protein QBC40DRAFT_308879 [Triangularia verruculosa]